MAQLFISYANEDTEFARRLAGALHEQGWSVWWDKQIPPGMDYAQVIEKAVTEASCIIILWSKHSIGSRWVQTEAAEAADRHIAATVLIDETPGERIPFEFRRLQAVDLSDWRAGTPHNGFDRLANRIRSILDETLKMATPIHRDSDKLVSWKEAVTHWGRGKQRLFRTAALLVFLIGVWLLTEPTGGRLYPLVGALLLMGAAIFLLHRGRHPP